MANQKNYIKRVDVTNEGSSAIVRGERLRRVRNMANLTRLEMCSDETLNVNTLKGWEIARYGGLPKDGAEKVLERVSREGVVCSREWLLHGVGVGPSVISDYKQLHEDKLKCTEFTSLSEENELIINEIVLFKEQHPESTDFKVEDDGLSPTYNKGDYVAGVKYYKDRLSDCVGHDCIVQAEDGVVRLRHLKASDEPNKFMLLCTNHNTSVRSPVLYNVEIVSAAPVVRHYRFHTLVDS